MPLYGLNCYSILKHETLVFSLRAVKQVQERLLFHLNRAAPLHQKFKYMDYKKTLLCEGEDENRCLTDDAFIGSHNEFNCQKID
ncbi:unnamed protein product [Soboliphyme baturini]|uniref:Uncharacterized protein n=1 Tax=Soboliphyme baturini TaxID=241478 RepID=A0A183IT13_9BILA|nr:unnamed protein product [Soboliphyme baturini]